MSLGLSQKLNVLPQSPLDGQPPVPPPPGSAGSHWSPSHYNVHAGTDDGRLILWNTLHGTMSVFESGQAAQIRVLLTQKGFAAERRGIVEYLSERGFLIRAGTDERRQFRVRFGHEHFRTDRLELILLASEDCNFRCQYCYEDFARGTMQPWVREAIKKLVQERARSLRSLSITWFGGEPLYGWPAIEDLAPHFAEFAEREGLYYSSRMTTNGYLLTPEVADRLLAWKVNDYQITLDGAPEDHDASRPGRNGEPTFATIFANLQALHRRDTPFTVHLRVNYAPTNHPRLSDFLALVERELEGDSRFQLLFRAVGRWGGDNDAQVAVCGGDEAQRIQRELVSEARRRGLALSGELREVAGFGTQVCYAARPYNFIIGAQGQVMKCTIDLDKKDRNVVGQLTEAGRLQLDGDRFALWTEPAFEEDAKCQKCVVLPLCQGLHCPQERMDHHTSPCTPLRRGLKGEMRGLLQRREAQARDLTVRSNRVSDKPATA